MAYVVRDKYQRVMMISLYQSFKIFSDAIVGFGHPGGVINGSVSEAVQMEWGYTIQHVAPEDLHKFQVGEICRDVSSSP